MAGPRKPKFSPASDAEKIGEIKATLNAHTESLTSIEGELKTMNVNFAAYNSSLETHIARTNLLEEMHQEQEKNIDDRLMPIERHVTQVSFIGKLATTAVVLPAAIYYIIQLFRVLTGKL
jgi:DNA-binding transcriptional regulator YbjK